MSIPMGKHLYRSRENPTQNEQAKEKPLERLIWASTTAKARIRVMSLNQRLTFLEGGLENNVESSIGRMNA